MERELFTGAQPRVFVTNPDSPEDGRTFVWAADTRWHEREEGVSGAVEFTHVADSQEELEMWLAQEGYQDITELDDDYAEMVREEFMNQTPLYPEAPETSEERPFREEENI